MAQTSNRSWDAGRFLQTLTFFDSVPVISWLQKMIFGSNSPAPPQLQEGVIFDFSQEPAVTLQAWGALDDVVMGGVSASAIRPEGNAALFTGNVSTANSGGFASVRTRNFESPLNLSSYSGIELQIKGDGQRYKFLLRDSDGWDSIAYTLSFDTVADHWMSVQVPFSQLKPVFRAKTVANASPLNTTQIRSMQLMLSKFEYDGDLNPHFSPGEFKLWVQRISVY